MNWRAAARAVITKALGEARDMNLSAESTTKLVDSRYPFGERRYWPYKVWLEERKKLVFGKYKPRLVRPPVSTVIAGQLELMGALS